MQPTNKKWGGFENVLEGLLTTLAYEHKIFFYFLHPKTVL